ncbi:ShlB/FhaC/HecB family hemolysin secretion/activation protein [uncultured Desulfuromonas sp.]|uniref:ShlB/FhaC/HecB family hemolysin secretion/activation protein n=1 Tax=uncultured Desulfuromonas sp. TaxID=181013 RepID=UPI002AABFDF4|nr:ShlB/FhaC/HecB family hemolysin secretion/activation protein [uncultured Desulfuromonas sp.]
MSILILLIWAATCFAGPPDAGQLLREQRPQQTLPQRLPAPDQGEGKPITDETAARILVREFLFTGYDGLATADELQDLVADFVGKELDYEKLQAVAARVTRYLKERGWLLARAWLPSQDVSNGRITIAIVQGKSDGTLEIDADDTLRIRKNRLEKIGAQGIRRGEPVRRADLERAVLLMNDLPGIRAKAILSPGGEPGSIRVTYRASEGPLLNGTLMAENFGNRYTGTLRFGGTASLNDPLGLGDRLTLSLSGSRGLKSGRLRYALPLLANGLSWHIDSSYLTYELGEEFSNLDVTGSALTIATGISYPWWRSRKANVTATLDYEYRELSDEAMSVAVEDTRLHRGALGLHGDYNDDFFNGGLTLWGLSAGFGRLSEATADLDITGSEGSYTIFNLEIARLQRLTPKLTLNAAWRAQYSLDNLDSSEQFALGGPYGIRAYSVSEALGDSGHLFTLETRYALKLPNLPGHLEWMTFFDAGHITLHHSPWANAVSTETGKNRYWLAGAGTGLSYRCFKERLHLQLFWAHAIGDNDGRSSDGTDAEGRDRDQRVWAQAKLVF